MESSLIISIQLLTILLPTYKNKYFKYTYKSKN